jgi:putative flippase GtrA
VILTPQGLLEHSRTEAGRRMIRYASTSLICVAITQVLIVVFYRGAKWTEVESNLAATMLTSIPAYILNKYWVWGKRGRPHMRREVIPFWVFTVAGWALSTAMVALASDHVGTPHSFLRTFAVMVASISGFGILWVLKYLFLDKIMFGTDHHTPYDEDEEQELAVVEARAAGATEL